MTQPIHAGNQQTSANKIDAAGVSLEVHSLGVSSGKKIHPIQDVSLYIPPRSLVAVAGPAGAGKTTLIESLAGVKVPTTGQIFLDGVNLYTYRKSFLPRIGYVSTRNRLHLLLTVTENIDNMLRLRLPKGTPGANRKARIDEVIAFLGLSDVRDQKLSSLGPLEQFLTRVGAELAGSPIILLVDEPENTLDPAGIHRLLDIFHAVAQQGINVVFVTGSPSAMQTADYLLLMDCGGYMVYFGPPEEAPAFFENGEEHEEPAAPAVFETIFYHNQKSPKDWAAQYKAYPGFAKYVDDPLSGKRRDLMLEDRPLSRMRGAEDEPSPPRDISYSSSIGQFFTLLIRNIRLWSRDRSEIILSLGVPLVLSMGILFVLDPSMYSPVTGDASQINQVFAVLVILALLVASFAFVRQIVIEKAALTRERQVNLRPIPYALSKLILVIPFSFYQAFVLTLSYALATQSQGGGLALVGIFITLFLTSIVGGLLGLIASSLGSSLQTATLWVMVLVLPQLIFGGVFFASQQQGAIGSAVSVITPARYAFESLVSSSRYGEDVAEDVCWALPPDQRRALTDAQKQNCTCMGSNIFAKCNFPGLRGAVTNVLDQPAPTAPIPDTGMDQLPVQPLLQPGETLDQFTEEITQYTLQLESYLGSVSNYLGSLQKYLSAAIEWEKLQSFAIGSAEAKIAGQIDRYGNIYSVNLAYEWLILIGISLVLGLVMMMVQIGKGRV